MFSLAVTSSVLERVQTSSDESGKALGVLTAMKGLEYMAVSSSTDTLVLRSLKSVESLESSWKMLEQMELTKILDNQHASPCLKELHKGMSTLGLYLSLDRNFQFFCIFFDPQMQD